MANEQTFWAAPCDFCGFPIALARYDGKNEVLKRLPERFAAFCMACGQDRECVKSRIESRVMAAAEPGFQPHPAFALEWHKQVCSRCIEASPGQWDLCQEGQELLRQMPTLGWRSHDNRSLLPFCKTPGGSMLHKTSRERYDKLKRLFHRLMNDFNRDDLDDFIATASSMPEWVRQDSTLIQEQKDALERFVVPESVDWQVCRQIANQQKHAKPSRRSGAAPPLVVNSVQINPGGTGFFHPSSRRVIGAGQEIFVECGGSPESALAFVIRTFKHFHYIFEIAPIPLAQRDLPKLLEIFA
jgi:hypothetical protein